jgi:hypothetical protein
MSNALQAALKTTIGMDVCIVMDTTSSMTKWLKMCKEQAAKLGPTIKKKIEENNAGRTCEVKVGFVSCKDFNRSRVPEEGHLASHPLDANGDAVQATINSVSPSGGGGDWCEDVAGALDVAANPMMGWARQNRLVIHFLDAPPHGKEYHDLGPENDHHMDVGDGLTQTLREMARQRICYSVVQCVDDQTKIHLSKYVRLADAVYTEEARALVGRPGKTPKFNASEVQHDNYQQLFAIVVDSCVMSVDPTRQSALMASAMGLAKSKNPTLSQIPEGPPSDD